jgi:hypothetical protein
VAVSRIDWPEVQFGANRAQVEVRNLGRRRRHLTISLGEEGEPPAQTVEVDLALRTERTVSLNLDLQRRGPGRLVTTVRDRDTGETLFTSASPRYVIPPLLTAERVSPRYRPAVYATDPDQTVTVAVRLTPERPDLLLYVALCPAGIPEGTDPRAWLEEALKYHLFIGRTEPAEVAFDLSPMAPGAYEVRVWLTEAGGGVVAEERRPIWKVPKWEQETFVDHHQRLLVAGQPFFPLGLYKTPKERLAEIRQAGFNTVTPPDFGFGPHVREYLDAAQEAGLKVTPIIWCNAGWVKEQELHRHPAVLAWYMTDEPGGRNQEDPQQTLDAYQSLCEFDPYHPTLLVDNTLTDHARGADIIAPDIYPISFCAETGTNWPLAEIARKIRQVQQTDFTQHRAVWFVPQAIGGWGSVQIPTLRQERAMVYGAVCLGAKGILWYAYDTPELPGWNVTQEPELWPALKQIAAELGRLSPVLLSVEEPTDVSMEPDAPEILWRVCRHKGADYLLAVNWQSGFATPTFTFADGRTATAREVFTDQSVLVQEGQLRLTLAPLEVAVMRCP